jgi:hypothetical protein
MYPAPIPSATLVDKSAVGDAALQARSDDPDWAPPACRAPPFHHVSQREVVRDRVTPL